jgi:hypothetical protein
MNEHPNWKQCWIGFAQYGDKVLILTDRARAKGGQQVFHGARPHRYDVLVGPEPCVLAEGCEDPSVPHGNVLWSGDDIEEGRRAFDDAQAALIAS